MRGSIDDRLVFFLLSSYILWFCILRYSEILVTFLDFQAPKIWKTSISQRAFRSHSQRGGKFYEDRSRSPRSFASHWQALSPLLLLL